ncbi:MAG TPA: dihydropteroate synthase [Gammaproteobacteria bacterium]|nr:dihydropteroate synthase [Gammaproteobacteria bacterium]
MHLELGRHRLDLSRPRVMGILNRTPDSFSDGGAYAGLDAALQHARGMARDGADIIDVGGESTRPGAAPVGLQEELDRVIPVIERLTREMDTPLSVDTSKPEVMGAAVKAGAAMINDVYALRQPGALEAAARSQAAVCLMHMQGEPRSMQNDPHYIDVVREVADFLQGRADAAVAAGIPGDKIVLDPGFGFGKTLGHNLELLRHLPDLAASGYPLLVGLSRKSMIGTLMGGVPPEGRLQGSVAAALIAAQRGARVLRVHDVAATVQALNIAMAVERS